MQTFKDGTELLKEAPVIGNTSSDKKVVVAGNMGVRACQHLGNTTIAACTSTPAQ